VKVDINCETSREKETQQEFEGAKDMEG